MIIISSLILFVLLFPPSKYDVLKTFCQNWLSTEKVEVEPYYYFPLHPTNFYPPERQKTWLEPLTPPILQCDVNRDGIMNFIDYAALVKLMGELNWFSNINGE